MRRKADHTSLWLTIIALGQLLTVGVVVTRAWQADLTVSQAVINQHTTDGLAELNRRVDNVDKQIDRLSQLGTAVFVGLAMNLVATIVQIRTQTARRDDHDRGRH